MNFTVDQLGLAPNLVVILSPTGISIILGIVALLTAYYLLHRQINQRLRAETILRQQTERERLINQIAQQIRQSLNLEEVLATTVAEVRTFLECDRVLIYRIWGDGTGSAITETVLSPYPKILGVTFPEEVFPNEYHQAYIEGKSRAITNVDQTDIEPCLAEFVKQFEVKAKLVVPIIQEIRSKDKTISCPYLWGLLIAHQCRHTRQWQPEEIELMKQLANQVAIAIQQSELYEQLQKLNNEVRMALEREKELSVLKTRFFSMASHEFRTPLSTVLAAAQLLENSPNVSHNREKWLRNLKRIQDSVKHMVQLLDDILTINRAETGKLEFNPEPLNIEQFCRQFVEEMQLSTGNEHTLKFACQGEETYACLDEKLLRSILANLLSNAIKYSPKGGQILFFLNFELNNITIQIRDRGVGISAEDQKQLFEPFYRGKNVRQISGTGLGLVVVKKCVDLHGGNMAIASELGRGTTVTIKLPTSSSPTDEIHLKSEIKPSWNRETKRESTERG